MARLAAARSRAEAVQREFQAAGERYQALTGPGPVISSQELLWVSADARLFTRFSTMPVIEQAKGILIAQQGCTAEEAFSLLRRASQRSNVPVRELAAQIVTRSQHPATVTYGGAGGSRPGRRTTRRQTSPARQG
jgi:hypothetical protein